MDRRGLLGLAGGLLGIAAVFMPWLVLTTVVLTQVEVGLSGFQMVLEVLQGVARDGEPGGEGAFLPSDPAAQMFVTALFVLAAGVIFFLLGSAVSLFNSDGGYVMIGAAVISALAISVMSIEAEEALGTASVLMGVGYGLLVGFLASGVVLAGRFLGFSDEEPYWTQQQLYP